MALAPTGVTYVRSPTRRHIRIFLLPKKANTSKFQLIRFHIRLLYKEPQALLCYVVKLITLTFHILHGL